MSEQKLIEVTLAKPHTHAGHPYKAGEKIKVSERKQEWLLAHGIITAPATKEKK